MARGYMSGYLETLKLKYHLSLDCRLAEVPFMFYDDLPPLKFVS